MASRQLERATRLAEMKVVGEGCHGELWLT